MANILKYVQQSLTESQQNQVFANWGLGDTARLDYDVVIQPAFIGTISVTYPSGAACTIAQGSTTYTAPSTSGSWNCTVYSTGQWTVRVVSSVTTTTKTITLSEASPYQSVVIIW